MSLNLVCLFTSYVSFTCPPGPFPSWSGRFLLSLVTCSSLTPPLPRSLQYLQRRQQENTQRQSRGEPPLPEEDITKMFKPPQPPPRMDTLLIAGMYNHKSWTHHPPMVCTRDPPLTKLHQPPPLPHRIAVLLSNYLHHYRAITLI